MKNVITKRFIKCPHCGLPTSSIDDLLDGTYGGREYAWYCDTCGKQYYFKISQDSLNIETEKSDEYIEKTMVYLKYHDMVIVCEGISFNGKIDSENQRYFYNEHTCPTNYLKNVLAVIDVENGDNYIDPHGIFEYLGTKKFPLELDKFGGCMKMEDEILDSYEILKKEIIAEEESELRDMLGVDGDFDLSSLD